MATTAHLGLTLVESAQAQKEVTVNTALTRIDALLNTGVKDKDSNAAPGSPAAGDVYIVGSSPTGAWSGQASKVAYFEQVWRFITPHEGLSLWVNDEDKLYTYNGSAWVLTQRGGRQAVYIPAGSMRPSSSGGCASLAIVATAANRPDIASLDFDASTEEYAQFCLKMPKSWNEGTLSAILEWSHGSATGSYGVVWGVQGLAVSDADSINAAYGTPVEVTDTGGAADTLYKSPEIAAITLSGSPAQHDTVFFRVYRKAADAADSLSADARLHGLTLFYTSDAATED